MPKTKKKAPPKTAKKVTKKDFNAFLKFIWENNHKAAALALDEKPELTQAIYAGGSQKYDSQTLLMIAVKYDSPEIVHHLLDAGSDLQFVDDKSSQAWYGPILNLAIYCFVISSYSNDYKLLDAKMNFLRRMLQEGADPARTDSRGKSAYRRFVEAVYLRTDDVYFMEDGKESSHKEIRRSASYVRKVHDLLVEFNAKPEDLEVLSQTQAKRVGLDEFLVDRPEMPPETWGPKYSAKFPDAETQAECISVCETIATMFGKGRAKTKKHYFGVFLDDKPVPRSKLKKDAVKFLEMTLKDSELKKQWAIHKASYSKWRSSVNGLKKRLQG